ncbi:hypothetical protein PYW08_011067 [Mythimna loreyi]|uniref:Uncharacterized protein n=1 Tax=Mythimna loreyi TaxID=667449 RepID=A0ACC2Q7C2_9NEOP|nr:hypothetical protein PYW08_011067 [Mythimna loreyi]
MCFCINWCFVSTLYVNWRQLICNSQQVDSLYLPRLLEHTCLYYRKHLSCHLSSATTMSAALKIFVAVFVVQLTHVVTLPQWSHLGFGADTCWSYNETSASNNSSNESNFDSDFVYSFGDSAEAEDSPTGPRLDDAGDTSERASEDTTTGGRRS